MTQTMAGLKEIALEVRARWVSHKLHISWIYRGPTSQIDGTVCHEQR